MAVDFSDTLVIGISSRALFDLEEENRIFQEKGVNEYRAYQKLNEDVVLNPGTAFHIVKALLNLNTLADERLVEVIVLSRNSPETGIRVLNTIGHLGLDITRSAFTGGESLSNYMDAFSIDLFLSKDEHDVQAVIDLNTAAAALIYPPPSTYIPAEDTVRIAFDADAVIFSEESEVIYKTSGLNTFHDNERNKADVPLKEGPYAKLLKTLSKIQHKINTGVGLSPIRIAIVTARNSPSHMRVLNTLREWNVHVDEAFFLGGISKDKILQAFRAHIFFDDQDVHVKLASVLVPCGRVPYKSSSVLKNMNDLKIQKVSPTLETS